MINGYDNGCKPSEFESHAAGNSLVLFRYRFQLQMPPDLHGHT